MYWRGGRLLTRITDPGLHLRLPLTDSYELVQVTMQTDKVTDIPCGTKGGVSIAFEKIEVVNRLSKAHAYDIIKEYGIHYDKTWIYDKIHHEINQFCSFHTLQEVYIDKFDEVDEKIRDALQADITKYARGIEIISVRVTKPRIPEDIMENYVMMEVERTKAMVALERQKVVEREIEVERTRAIAEAERAAQRSPEQEAAKKTEEIQNEMYMAKQRAAADAAQYAAEREAAGWALKLTPQFLEYTFLQAISNNTKMWWGERLPAMVTDQRLLGGLFDGLRAEKDKRGPAGQA